MTPHWETLSPEAALPGLCVGRYLVGIWLIDELAKHHGVPTSFVERMLDRMPTNYVNLLDSADGINLLSIIVGEALGQREVEPFCPRLQ